MDTRLETVHIAVEDIGNASWWAALLLALTAPTGGHLLRFVAHDGARVVGISRAFGAPRTFDAVAPQGAWVVEMRRCLEELCDELEMDGFLWTGAGAVPWEVTYERLSWAPAVPEPGCRPPGDVGHPVRSAPVSRRRRGRHRSWPPHRAGRAR